jgi:hypothetical protein
MWVQLNGISIWLPEWAISCANEDMQNAGARQEMRPPLSIDAGQTASEQNCSLHFVGACLLRAHVLRQMKSSFDARDHFRGKELAAGVHRHNGLVLACFGIGNFVFCAWNRSY